MTIRRLLLGLVLLVVLTASILGWIRYQQLRTEYDAYRSLIQPGVTVAGIPVGGLSPDEARELIEQKVAEPYYRDFRLLYQDTAIPLSPKDDLKAKIPVEEMVEQAVVASHQYDYWQGFRSWILGEKMTLDLDVPLQLTFDPSAAARRLAAVAEDYDAAAVEPMVDVQARTFIPGRPGRKLAIQPSAASINELVSEPDKREVHLEVTLLEPDHNPARIQSMLSTLGPVMERPPTPPRFYTATVPLSTTIELSDTSGVTESAVLTWTHPHFISYTGHLTTTYGFFFEPGQPGLTFDLENAALQVDKALKSGKTDPIYFDADFVPPPPITPGLLTPPLEARLAQFPGVSSILVKNLDTGEMVYESNADYILSGMSIVKIGIMVEVYRHFGGVVDEQTHQELLDMLGSESCNPCANRLMAAVGSGSPQAGAQKVTETMRQLGLENFYLCAPFRVVELWPAEGGIVRTAAPATLGAWNLRTAQAQTPRYDRCVRATPREMAALVEMIHNCAQADPLPEEDKGLLVETYPSFTSQTCQEMIDIMAANDLRNMLGAGIPDEVKLAHKHGFSGYDVPWGDTRGEVGIVYSPGAAWLISFYIWEDTPWIDWGVNQPLYRDVSNMLYNYFNPEDPYWPLPPWAPSPEEETAGETGT